MTIPKADLPAHVHDWDQCAGFCLKCGMTFFHYYSFERAPCPVTKTIGGDVASEKGSSDPPVEP